MHELKFDPEVCASCPTCDCIMKCQYMDLELDEAQSEHAKLVAGEDSSILHDCVTCYACEEYCPFGNHPFYLIVERQEQRGVHPVPKPLEKSQVVMMGPNGKMKPKEVSTPVMNMCFFTVMNGGIRGKLFEGVTKFGGSDVFCNLMFLHFARNSTIKERLPLMIDNIMEKFLKPAGIDEIICYHDECYGTYTSWAPAFGIEVPFKTIHLFDFIYHRLLELEDQITPLDVKVAYQRPCSNRLCPQTDHFVDDIFSLIGAERPRREFEYENALCCGGVPEAQQRFELTEELQQKNIEDMKATGASYCVFNCPFCFWTLSEPVLKAGLVPIMMSDLCLMALGQ